MRDGQANYCRKPVRKEVLSLGNEELWHKSILLIVLQNMQLKSQASQLMPTTVTMSSEKSRHNAQRGSPLKKNNKEQHFFEFQYGN